MKTPFDYTHYHPASGTVFHLEHCENCGGEIQDVNSAHTFPDQEPILRAVGIVFCDTLPPEGEWSDELDCEVCPRCR